MGLATVIKLYACPADSRTFDAADVFIEQSNIVRRVAFTSYLGNEGTNQFSHDGVLYVDSTTRMSDIVDGTSTTLLVGERPPSADLVFGWWYAGTGQEGTGSADSVLGARELCTQRPYYLTCPDGPYDFGPGQITNQCDAFHYWSLHVNGANFVFADGSLRFLTYAANPILPALATRAGSESIDLP